MNKIAQFLERKSLLTTKMLIYQGKTLKVPIALSWSRIIFVETFLMNYKF